MCVPRPDEHAHTFHANIAIYKLCAIVYNLLDYNIHTHMRPRTKTSALDYITFSCCICFQLRALN